MERISTAFSQLQKDGFNIERDADIISKILDLKYEDIFSILSTFEVSTFEDVDFFLHQVKDTNSVPIIWTQGQVGDNSYDFSKHISIDNQISDLPFQVAKILRSNLHSNILNLNFKHRVKDLPIMFGSSNKTSNEFLNRLTNEINLYDFKGGPIFIDDKEDNLINVRNFFSSKKLNSAISLFFLNRSCESLKSNSDQIVEISSLKEVIFEENSLVFVDLDGTLINTNSMKIKWYREIEKLLEK